MGSTSAPKAKKDPMTKVLAKIGKKEWDRYKQDFAPVEKDFRESVSELGSGRDRDQLAGRGISELHQQTGPSAPSSKERLVNRSLGKMSGESRINATADLQSLERKGKGLNAAISLGRDIGQGALGEIGRQSQLGTMKNIADAEAAGIKQQGMMDAVGTVAGAAAYRGLNKKTPDTNTVTKSSEIGVSGGRPMVDSNVRGYEVYA